MEPAEHTADALTGQAITALTALARQTRIRGAGTPAATSEPVDFADLAAHVLTAVAANVGSVATLLAGRPGSWEADLLRRLLEGTAGEDADELVRWRTEPIRIWFDAADVLDDLGIGDLYQQEEDQIAAQVNGGTLTEAEQAAGEDLLDAIYQLWEQDQAAYTAAFRETAERYLAEIGGTCALELGEGNPATVWDAPAETIREYARRHTPLPMTGSAPDWSDGTPADALRRAGITFTARVNASRT
ncbi:hypothetical protein [Actinoplanes sp. G11-F43]|uniref:hypothetical protein n=1 Tax=Actinoplanes sp. G11-F43 TaxID=3424130 RepID=UPI003D32C0A2